MTPHGLAYVKRRLTEKRSEGLEALARYWQNDLSLEAQRDPEIIAYKDRMKGRTDE